MFGSNKGVADVLIGGNFALVGRPSVGASGAIVGTLAVLWVDLMVHWNLEYKPWVKVWWWWWCYLLYTS
jgi:hypothetical protein